MKILLILHCAISSDVVEEDSVFLVNVNFCKNALFWKRYTSHIK